MIGGKPVAEARVGLLLSESGGLEAPMPTGTRSLLLVFPSLEDEGKEVMIGAVIDVMNGSALAPGAEGVPVPLRFWAGEAAVYAVPGAAFTLRRPRRHRTRQCATKRLMC
jgi:hypothetical protein